jgi:ABC-type nitrate/sulfonate/bicarbonate transport system substrate-binding protein
MSEIKKAYSFNRREFLKYAGAAGALGLAGGSLLTGCSPKELATTVQLSWIANTQFAGFYAANIKGFYEDEKLVVDIAPGGPGISPGSLVDSQQKDIGCFSASVDLIKANTEGTKLIAFAGQYERSPAGLIYIKKHPDGTPGTIIDTPEAAKGKRIGLQSILLAWRVVCQQAGLDLENDMEIVTVGYDPSPLLDGTVDGYWGFSTNQMVTLESMGYEVGFLDAYDWGYKVPGNFIACHQDFYNENKALLERFTRASILGWAYANNNVEELTKYTVDTYGEDYGLVYDDQLIQANAQIPYMETEFTKENGLLAVKMEDWENAIKILTDMGEITGPVDIDTIATTEIIDAVYKDGRIDQA